MYSREKLSKKERFQHERRTPSFSSTLLDEIYRSIDEGGMESREFSSYRETMKKKQSNSFMKSNRATEEKQEEMSSLQRACMIEKWMQRKVSDKVSAQRRQSLPELDRKSQYDNDALFFSTTSSSSDSSSGGFSSSETESVYGGKTRSSCFLTPRLKPVRTSVSVRSEKSSKTEKTEKPLLYEQREVYLFNDYHYNSVTEPGTKHEEEGFIKSKSRALKIYSNLKKVKQPLSPGGRLASFLNSLFTAGNSKKTKNSSSIRGADDVSIERNFKSTQASTCSSASSFSRSCLSKNSPSSREKLRNGVKRSVRFYPVSIIVDEDSRPCGHKCLYEEDEAAPKSTPSLRKLVNSPTRRNDKELLKFQLMEKSRRVEEAARDILKGYHQNQNQNQNQNQKRMTHHGVNDEDDDDDDDDAASYSSSDLFELDHRAFIGNNDRYREELPVYETTHVSTNRAIANGLIL